MNNEKEKDEEISIDFGKIAGFFKKKKKREEIEELKEGVEEEKKEQKVSKEKEEVKEIKEEIKKPEEQKETEEFAQKPEKKEEPKEIKEKAEKSAEVEEEIAIDLSKIKNFFKRKEKPKKEISEKVEATEEKTEEEISLDFKKFGSFLSKYKFLLLLLIPIFLSIFFRAYTLYLPVTDDWARNSVYGSVKSEIEGQINEQYPFLSDVNKQALVNDQFEVVLKQQSKQIEQQVKQVSNYFKSRMQDENGHTYLLAIDPYLWYGYARNYLRNGHFGTDIVNGKPRHMLRNGRVGKVVDIIMFNSFIEVQLYRILNFFDRNTSLLDVAFLIPLIIITLSVIPAFFIAKRIGGSLAGLFAATIVAVNSSLLGRTIAGFSDTDPYQIFFPLLIAWVFLEAFEAKNTIKMIILAGLSGLLIGIYSLAWLGWWYILDFILATLVLYLIYNLIIHIREIKKGFLKYISHPAIKNTLIILAIIFLFSLLFVSLFTSFNNFAAGLSNPIGFIRFKGVAVKALWPDVITTVAEFNEPSFSDVISIIGGRFLFLIALLGIILTMIKKDKYGKIDVKYAIFLTIWFIATIYASTKGLRFVLLLVPAFAIAFGTAIGIIYQYVSKWLTRGFGLNKYLSKTILIIVLSLLLISPLKTAHRTAKSEIPSFNDAWYEALTEIKNNSTDAIITSWWDFGHWFVTISERRVTFDGADQGKRIHWVGRSLLTSNEEEAIGILRMLNCGQEESFKVLDSYINDTVKSINILYEIILKDKEEAKKTLLNNNLSPKEADSVLKLTHCNDLIDQYYITSEDMVGKTGVWAHFGSWDFNRAAIFNAVKREPQEIGIKILEERFNLPTNDAFLTYHDIQKSKADKWISGWPGYASGLADCKKTNKTLTCGNGFLINLTTNEAFFQTQQGLVHPTSFVFTDEKGFHKIEYPGNTIPYSAALIREGENFKSISMSPELAASMFTRLFFFNGYDLKHFKPFSYRKQFNGQIISVWKVDFQ